ncbi:hypothetical protein mRhiFer1_009489 [Rhinolophus ferrumequinum]|uniref:Uncharacterized protein n=1 Tax=Rhinolophus ferrumequinum TaxID=59479 RepID=A0A7J7RF55_RHIFE|nr:hypothetical protein mRhiFer1_009489 [Rhinolophus ferrumequinum]
MKVEDVRILFFFFFPREDPDTHFHIIFLKYTIFFSLSALLLSTPPPPPPPALRHLKARHNDQQSSSLSGSQPVPPTHNQGGCMQCLPSDSTAQLSADPGWKSCTHCGKIKDNNIPFLLPQTASIFNPFLAFKTKTPCPSPCRSQGTLAHVTQIHMPHLVQKSHLHRPIRDI